MNKTRKKSICQLFHEIEIFLDFFFRTAAICRAGNKQVSEIKTATKEKTRRKKKYQKNGFSEGPNSS